MAESKEKQGVWDSMLKFDYNLALYPLQIRPQHIFFEQHYAKVYDSWGNEKGGGWGSKLLLEYGFGPWWSMSV